MKVVFRTDASLKIGNGHVMRCLTLADAIRKRGFQSIFVSRPSDGHLFDLIAQQGHQILMLPTLPKKLNHINDQVGYCDWLGTDWEVDAKDTKNVLNSLGGEVLDWLVVDHYALDHCWERVQRPSFRKIMVIDDLANRSHDCDLLLDQNLNRLEKDYCGLINLNAKVLIGPEYALLRPEFNGFRNLALKRRSSNSIIKNLLVTMGGVDNINATSKVLCALKGCKLENDICITVVMGPHSPWREQVKSIADSMPWQTKVLIGVSNMAELMVHSDLAIGAAGSSSWERCCLGLPTIQVPIAENQIGIANVLHDVGAAVMVDLIDLSETLPRLFASGLTPESMRAMALAGSSLTQGRGADQIVTYMSKPNDNHVSL